MKNATELLTAYLAQIQDPAAAAAPFADDGVIELPWINARAQGPVEIEKFLVGLLAKVPDFRFQNIRMDSDARPSLRRVRRGGACAVDRQDLSTDLRRTPRRGERKDRTLARSARYQGCVTGIQQGLESFCAKSKGKERYYV